MITDDPHLPMQRCQQSAINKFTDFSPTFNWFPRINWHMYTFWNQSLYNPHITNTSQPLIASKFKFHRNTEKMVTINGSWVVLLKLNFFFETHDCSSIMSYKNSSTKFSDFCMTFPINLKIPWFWWNSLTFHWLSIESMIIFLLA